MPEYLVEGKYHVKVVVSIEVSGLRDEGSANRTLSLFDNKPCNKELTS